MRRKISAGVLMALVFLVPAAAVVVPASWHSPAGVPRPRRLEPAPVHHVGVALRPLRTLCIHTFTCVVMFHPR
jgi:hypothetical protein